MRHLFSIALGGVLWLAFSPSYALTGNEYRTLPEPQRLAWTVGVADGILATQLIASNKKPPLADCLAKFEREQIRAMFEKAIEKEPERWHFPAAFTFYATFQKHCGLE